ncbi:MAG: TRAP transporter permease, partial [Syntrophaceae bacterium]|nr:TRAP transporter permease [Syntrophaceae bacterium]
LTAEEADELIQKFDKESRVRTFNGIPAYIIATLLVLFAVFVFSYTLIINLPEQVRRTAFVGGLLFLGFLLFPAHRKLNKRPNYIPWYDLLLAVAGASCFFYYTFNFRAIIDRAILLTPQDVYIGLVGILILAELCRRVVGLPILVVAGGFITYAFFQGLSFGTAPYSVLRRLVNQLFYTTDGIIGTPIGVVSSFVIIFIFLASFLDKSGIGQFFIELASSVAGWASGGPAKVAVVASAFEALVSGSSVANTVGSGAVTIPMMKKTGYKPEFAAAVEAAASTGGQIMPPILGAAAFLMAEITGIPYIVIAMSAIIPACLYFLGVFLMVHFEAKKLGLKGLPKDQMPRILPILLKKGYMFLPIFILVFLMGIGYTPAYAASLAVLSAFFVSLPRKETRILGGKLVEAVANGTKNSIGVGIACAVAGCIVGMVTLTGLGQELINQLTFIVRLPIFVNSGTSLLIALMITMLACLILGMGVPTTANYVIMATITAPMVLRAGMEIGVPVPMLAAHMFVFYFGILADVTPPVALAAYAGAAIANSNPIKTAITATRLAIAAFIIPYVFVLNPAMLWVDATPLLVLRLVIGAVIGMFGLAIGFEGFFIYKLKGIWRAMSIVGGILLVEPNIVTDLIGLGLLGPAVAVQVIVSRREKRLLNS